MRIRQVEKKYGTDIIMYDNFSLLAWKSTQMKMRKYRKSKKNAKYKQTKILHLNTCDSFGLE